MNVRVFKIDASVKPINILRIVVSQKPIVFMIRRIIFLALKRLQAAELDNAFRFIQPGDFRFIQQISSGFLFVGIVAVRAEAASRTAAKRFGVDSRFPQHIVRYMLRGILALSAEKNRGIAVAFDGCPFVLIQSFSLADILEQQFQ